MDAVFFFIAKYKILEQPKKKAIGKRFIYLFTLIPILLHKKKTEKRHKVYQIVKQKRDKFDHGLEITRIPKVGRAEIFHFPLRKCFLH